MATKSKKSNNSYTLNQKLIFVLEYEKMKRRAGKLAYLLKIDVSRSAMTRWKQKFERMAEQSKVNGNRKRLPKPPTVFQYPCIQLSPNLRGTPILPPNSMVLKSRVNPKEYKNPYFARRYYNIAMKRIENKRKHRKYFKGCKYTNIYFDLAEEIDTRRFGGLLDLNIKYDAENVTKLKIRDLSHETYFMKSLSDFNKSEEEIESEKGKGTNKSKGRDGSGDDGDMLLFGYRKKETLYASTRDNEYDSEKMLLMSTKARETLDKYFPEEVKDILSSDSKQGIKTIDAMGGENGVGAYTIVSRDLVNAPHLDVYDRTKSITVFNEKNKGRAVDWYFVLPNTIAKYGSHKKAIIIKLFHGCTLSWDGRKIFHCTGLKEVGENNIVYGNFWAGKKYK